MLRLAIIGLFLVAFPSVSFAQDEVVELIGFRGDANNDQDVDNSDVVFVLNHLLNSGPAPTCMNQADTNDDGRYDISDAVYLSNFLFGQGAPPPTPGPENPDCEVDPTEPHLGCEVYWCLPL